MKLNRKIAEMCFHVSWIVGSIVLTSRFLGVIMGVKEIIASMAIASSLSFLVASSLEGKRYETHGNRGAIGNRSWSRGRLFSLQERGDYHPDLQPSDSDSSGWDWFTSKISVTTPRAQKRHRIPKAVVQSVDDVLQLNCKAG